MSVDSNIDTIRQEYRFLAELVKRSGKDLLDRSVVVSGENFDAALSLLAADAGRATKLEDALESIFRCCEEGSGRSYWRPTVATIARAALADAGEADREQTT